jgi:biopolymer transport protein ExbB/TolQ
MLMEMGFRGIIKVNPVIISTLLVFSAIMLGFLLERAWFYLAYAGWDEKFWQKLRAAVQAGRLHEARTMCSQSSNVFAKVFYTALSSTHLTRADNEDLVQVEKENMQEKLRSRLGIFATFSFIAPLVGLLGTVTGIMQAFHDLARSGSGGANIVAAGISEALVATAMGILVAVPSSIFYNFFTYRLRSIVTRMNNYAQEIVILVYGGEATGDKPAQPKASEIRAKTIH